MKLFVSQLHSYLKGTLGCEAVNAGSGAVLSIGMCYFVSASTLSGSNEHDSLTPVLALPANVGPHALGNAELELSL